jgi:hypothetical protein
MQKTKRHLNIIRDKTNIIEGMTCFSAHAKHKCDCKKKSCQQWIDHPEGHNCVVISANDGPHTLQAIGQIFSLTRMRICQIEKIIFEKIKDSS